MFSLKSYFESQLKNTSEQEFTKIISFFQKKTIPKKDFLIHKDEISSLFFVSQGLLRVYDTHEEVERTFDFIDENHFGMVVKSFLSQSPSQSYVEAVEETLVYSIHGPSFTALCLEYPDLSLWYNQLLSHYLIEVLTCFDTVHNAQLPLYQRYEMLKKHPFFTKKILKKLSDKLIASFLFVQPESLSRMKNKNK